MLDVSRVEEKYVLNKATSENLYMRLRNILPGDDYQGYKPYMVRSLYFDSFYDDDYEDKIDGIENRKKIRLRIYNPNDTHAKLEVKMKKGENQRKFSIKITREEAQHMIRGEYDFLIDPSFSGYDALSKDIYYTMIKEVYRPKCMVNYTRRAFAIPTNNIRITFDSDIESSEGEFNIFSDAKRIGYTVESKNTVILEVKYNNFLFSYIKAALGIADMTRESYGKYIVSRKYGKY